MVQRFVRADLSKVPITEETRENVGKLVSAFEERGYEIALHEDAVPEKGIIPSGFLVIGDSEQDIESDFYPILHSIGLNAHYNKDGSYRKSKP